MAAIAPQLVSAAIYSVTNTADSGAGSLRQAILDANSGQDTIIFQIPGAGTHTIAPLSPLPALTVPVVIDGTSQPGFSNRPLIELNGASAGANAGLRVLHGNCTIQGLAINRFTTCGIDIEGPYGTNFIRGNFIGTDVTGASSSGNGQEGILIHGSFGNVIGGTSAGDGNLISGNADAGIYLLSAANNVVQGNLIGTTATGVAALPNNNNGVTVYTSNSNLLGGAVAGARNVISGNQASGIYLTGSSANLVQGNFVGTDTNGTMVISNAADGVTVYGASNLIGGANPREGNLISGNGQAGISLNGASAQDNLIHGNLIGTDASGRIALGNCFSGVTVSGALSNQIGGVTPAARNVISANKLAGVFLTASSLANQVTGNFIGVDSSGTNALGNLVNGISINNAASNIIGGATAGAGNVISGNANYGIQIFNPGATGNVIQGNLIGPDTTGQAALGNAYSGLLIQSAGNTVGGTVSGAANWISGNGTNGLFLDGTGAAANIVQGNFIGLAAGGTHALPNSQAGLGIVDAPNNIVGGTVVGAGNIISGNGGAGVYIIGTNATGNQLQGNRIGTDDTGSVALGNSRWGVYMEWALANSLGGLAPGAGNVISANNTWGLFLTNASWNTIQGNCFGTAIDGFSPLGNGNTLGGFHNIELHIGSHDNIVGGLNPGAGNRIAFAPVRSGIYYAGIRMRDSSSTNNLIRGNAIFSNGGLGVDLGAYLVNANVPCDAGLGANMAQNYPMLTQAISGTGTGVRGTLNSRPGATYLLEFFASPSCSVFLNGQGLIPLGQKTVVIGGDCLTNFVAALPVQVPPGYVVTATATDAGNNTSEFSPCAAIAPAPTLAAATALNRQLALSWTNIAGFVLKQSASLAPPIQWTTVTNTPLLTNGQFIVTLGRAAGNQFFRLSFE